jgi:hypothetical protein
MISDVDANASAICLICSELCLADTLQRSRHVPFGAPGGKARLT